METILMITMWPIVIMLFIIAVGLFGCLCYIIYEGIKYVYDEVVDTIKRRKEEKQIRKARKEYWKKLEEEKKQQCYVKGRFVYTK